MSIAWMAFLFTRRLLVPRAVVMFTERDGGLRFASFPQDHSL